MTSIHYVAPRVESAALEESDLIAGSFSDGNPIIGPTCFPELEEGQILYV